MKQNNEFLRHNVSLEYLKETFEYKNGFLYWKERPKHHFETEWSWKRFNKNLANTKAGILDKQSGYNIVSFRINGKKFKTKEHRVIWYLLKNEVPFIVDHIDRNRLNNSIENLRNVSYWENRLNSNNFKGTNFHKASGKWVAQYYDGKKRIHLGLFNSEWEAIQAYRSKVLEHRGIDLNRQNVFQDIEHWFKIAKPNPTTKDLITQIGCVIEETSELTLSLTNSLVIPELDKTKVDLYHKLLNATQALQELSKAFYEDLDFEIHENERVAIIDAMADMKVTLIGVANFAKLDLEGALVEVNQSNYSKFEDGKPLLNKNRKIMKGKDYFSPKLENYV